MKLYSNILNGKDMKGYVEGLKIGFLLQFAVGPVFFFIFNLSIHRGLYDALMGVAGVVLVDGIYIFVSMTWVGLLFQRKDITRGFSIFASLILTAFGLSILLGAFGVGISPAFNFPSWQESGSCFFSALLITGSDPITIAFWSGVFSDRIAESAYTRRELIYFGAGALSTTVIHLGFFAFLFSRIGDVLPESVVFILNVAVGGLLFLYGIRKAVFVLKC